MAIHLEFQLDCRARRTGLAMTNGEFISRLQTKRRRSHGKVSEQGLSSRQRTRAVMPATNKGCHGEKRSDVAIHVEFQLDCRARQTGLAMTIRKVHFREVPGRWNPDQTVMTLR